MKKVVRAEFEKRENVDLELGFEAIRRINDTRHIANLLKEKKTSEEYIQHLDNIPKLKLGNKYMCKENPVHTNDNNNDEQTDKNNEKSTLRAEEVESSETQEVRQQIEDNELMKYQGNLLITHPTSCTSQDVMCRKIQKLEHTPKQEMEFVQKSHMIFDRSVIALDFLSGIKQQDSTVFGLILNKKTEYTLRDLVPKRYYDDFEPFLKQPIYLGGVVPSPFIVLHKCHDAPNKN
eukprot:UN31665